MQYRLFLIRPSAAAVNVRTFVQILSSAMPVKDWSVRPVHSESWGDAARRVEDDLLFENDQRVRARVPDHDLRGRGAAHLRRFAPNSPPWAPALCAGFHRMSEGGC